MPPAWRLAPNRSTFFVFGLVSARHGLADQISTPASKSPPWTWPHIDYLWWTGPEHGYHRPPSWRPSTPGWAKWLFLMSCNQWAQTIVLYTKSTTPPKRPSLPPTRVIETKVPLSIDFSRGYHWQANRPVLVYQPIAHAWFLELKKAYPNVPSQSSPQSCI